jgi:uncharacterized protein
VGLRFPGLDAVPESGTEVPRSLKTCPTDVGRQWSRRWGEAAAAGRLGGCIWQLYTVGVPDRKDPLAACTGFEWDDANAHKNWERHRVTPEEAEAVFFNEPLVVRGDVGHSKHEKRYYALGQTDSGRLLFAAFTMRGSRLRVISVRDMNRKERDAYANFEKEGRA